MAAQDAALFGDTPEALRLTNPIAADLDQLRPTPIATLALAARRNAARGYPDVALFEVGPAYPDDAPNGQCLVAAGVRAGNTPRNWLAPARGVDAMDAKADLWAAMAAVGVPLDALMVSRGRAGLLPSRPLRHWCGRGRRRCWAASASCIRACWPRWTWPARWWRSS